jgi:hypothetical protein
MIVHKNIHKHPGLTHQVLREFCAYCCNECGPRWDSGCVLCIIRAPDQLQVPAWIFLIDVVAYCVGCKHAGSRAGPVPEN